MNNTMILDRLNEILTVKGITTFEAVENFKNDVLRLVEADEAKKHGIGETLKVFKKIEQNGLKKTSLYGGAMFKTENGVAVCDTYVIFEYTGGDIPGIDRESLPKEPEFVTMNLKRTDSINYRDFISVEMPVYSELKQAISKRKAELKGIRNADRRAIIPIDGTGIDKFGINAEYALMARRCGAEEFKISQKGKCYVSKTENMNILICGAYMR